MSHKILQLLQLPSATLAGYNGPAGEPAYDADLQTLRVFTGALAGGRILARDDQVEHLGILKGVNSQTGSYTLALTDIGLGVEINSASANNLTIPPNSSAAFPINTVIPVWQYGTGETTVVAGVGVTIRAFGGTLKFSGQYSGGTLVKRGTDEWIFFSSGQDATYLPVGSTTDSVPEGTTNKYFTDARVGSAILSGYALGTNATIGNTDSVNVAFGKTQAQINAKQATITGGATTITSANLTASRALASDSSGKVAVSAVTSTELGYLSGVTSAIQTQLGNKQALDATLTALAGGGAANTIDWFSATDTITAQTVNANAMKLLNATAAAGNIPYFDTGTSVNVIASTAAGRSMIAAADASAQRTLLGMGSVYSASLDTDGTMAANSDTAVPSQKAVRTYVATATTGLLDFKGVIDCSANPNYPAAVKGDVYVVSVAGKIGGASGNSVEVGDFLFATVDNAGGTQASVGTSWSALEYNITGALVAANNLSDVASAATARTNLGATTVGANLFTVTNPGTVSFIRIDAANTVTLRSASDMLADLAGAPLASPTFTGTVHVPTKSAAITSAANTTLVATEAQVYNTVWADMNIGTTL